MRIANLEYKKSILMIVLFLLCVFQMGILWSEKNPGIPFPFSPQRFWPKDETIHIDEVKANYLHPETIMVSDGIGGYWPVDSQNSLHIAVWEDLVESYFKQLTPKNLVGEKAYGVEWGSLVKMKCIMIEFAKPVPVGVVNWMIGNDQGASSPYKHIYKIAIFPADDINYTKNTLYITEDGKTVYKYNVTIEQGNMKKDDYIYAINTIREDDTLIQMNRLTTYYPSIKNDALLVCMDENRHKKIWDLRVKTPDEILVQRDNIDSVQEYLLNDYKGSMVTTLSNDGSNIIFSDDEKVVRFYQNGFFDYQYRNRSLGDKGLAEEALEKALTFIEFRRKELIRGAGIYLSEIVTKHENHYVFKFNYVMYDMEIKVLDEQNNSVHTAIEITANRERVLDVKWYIKTFENNDFDYDYNMFFNLNNKQLADEYPQLYSDPQIRDISIAYLYPESGMRAEPYWLVETDSKVICLKMQAEGE